MNDLHYYAGLQCAGCDMSTEDLYEQLGWTDYEFMEKSVLTIGGVWFCCAECYEVEYL